MTKYTAVYTDLEELEQGCYDVYKKVIEDIASKEAMAIRNLTKDMEERLKCLGFKNPNIEYSIDGNQDCGLLFTSENLCLETFAETYSNLTPKHVKLVCNLIKSGYVTLCVRKLNNKYKCFRAVAVDYDTSGASNHRRVHALLAELTEELDEIKNCICYDFYKELEDIYRSTPPVEVSVHFQVHNTGIK